MTKVRSRFVVATGGLILIVLGLCPVAASVISLVPLPVLGGAGIVLFGSVAASGIQTLASAAMEKGDNALIVAAAVGIGLIPIAAPDFYHHLPKDLLVVLDSGISTGCLVAIVLNLAFNHFGRNAADGDTADPTTADDPAAAGHGHPEPSSPPASVPTDEAGEPAAAPAH